MSEQSQGPGWWQASDGKWYPPEQAPAAQPPATQPIAGPPTGPPAGPPAGPPGATPPGPPPYMPPAAGGAAGGAGSNTGKIVAIVVALALIGGGAAFALTRGGGSSGSVKSFCDNATKFQSDDSLSKSSSDPAQIDKFVAATDQLTKSAPSEIKGDMQVIDDFVKKLAPGLKAAGNDPDKAIKALDDASNAVGPQKLETAEGNVEKFGNEKCGVDLGLSGSSSSTSDSGFSSFSTSSFNTDSSSSLDESSFSSFFSSFGSEFGSDFFSSLSSEFSSSS